MLFLAGVFLCCIGTIFLYDLLHQKRKIKETAKWILTQGTITCSKVDHTFYGGTIVDVEFHRDKSYFPNIRYEYTVEDTLWFGDRAYWMDRERGFKKKWVEDFVDQYSIGQLADVYYNPKDPDEAVLLVGMHGPRVYFGRIILAFAFLILGLFLMFLETLI